jgi:hypothetical protein
MVWQGMVSQFATRQGPVWHGRVGHGLAGHGTAWLIDFLEARPDRAGHGLARQG